MALLIWKLTAAALAAAEPRVYIFPGIARQVTEEPGSCETKRIFSRFHSTPEIFKLSVTSLRSKQSRFISAAMFIILIVEISRRKLKLERKSHSYKKNSVFFFGRKICSQDKMYWVCSNKVKTNHNMIISNLITWQLIFYTCSWWKKKSGFIQVSLILLKSCCPSLISLYPPGVF